VTTPAEPAVPQPTSPLPITPDVPAPAPSSAPTSQDVRDLVGTLAKQSEPDPLPFRKAKIVAFNQSANPPSLDIQFPVGANLDGSAGTPVTIPSVRMMDGFSPVVGDTVLVYKQGTDLLVMGQVKDNNSTSGGAPNGWQTAGNCRYRLVVDNGDFKVQFQGSFAVSGANLFVLPASYRPLADRFWVAASDNNNGFNRVGVTWTTGQVYLVNPNFFQGTDSVDPFDTANWYGGSTTGGYAGGWGSTGVGVATAGGDTGHYHATDTYAHSHFSPDHQHPVVGSHSHGVTVNMPSRVWFDNVEFFL
jgi:hypothetical protein